MGKNFIGVFISHGDTDEGHYPLSSLNAFRNVVNQLDRDTNGMIRIAFDYDGYEDHSKNNSTQNSILDTLDKLREQYEYLLFFRLMDPEYGRGMRIEYDEVQKLNRGVEPNKQIAVRTLVKKYDETDSNFDKAENTWDEITNKSNQESDVSKRYKNDEELTLKAGYMINKFYHLKKREKSFWKWLMAAIMVGILLWHFSGPIHDVLFRERTNVVDNSGVEQTNKHENVTVDSIPVQIQKPEIGLEITAKPSNDRVSASTRVENSVFLDVKALTFTDDYNAQLLSSIESCLLAKGFSIAGDKKSAHYNVWVEAKPTDATSAHIIHLDVSSRITDLKTGKIIYSDTKTHKDGAGSDEAAALKIYRRISKSIGEELSTNLH